MGTKINKLLTLSIGALAAAAFAFPATAAKIYSLNMSPSSVTAGTPTTMTATFKNETPNGNSTINSLSLTAPSGLTISSASSPNGTATVVSGGRTVNVTNMFPVSPNQTVALTLTVTSTPSCSASSGTWSSAAFEGSSLTGQQFGLVAADSSLTTTIASSGCTYSLTASPAAVNAGASTPLTLILTNTSSASAASISSLTLTAPPGFTITGASGSGSVAFTGTTVTVTGIAVTPGSPYTLSVTVSTAASCTGSGPVAWTSAVAPAGYTGSNPSTAINAQACSMTITGPTSAASGTPFSVTVNLINGPGGAQVTLSSSCGYTGAGTMQATGYSAVFTGTVGSPGSPPTTCSFNASANLGYGSAPPLAGFQVFGGVLGCSNTNNYDSINGKSDLTFDPDPDVAYVGTPGWGLRRGQNTDGANCVLVDYTFTQDMVNNVASLVYDKMAGPPPQAHAAFKYVVLWTPVAVDALPDSTAGWTQRRPYVAWGTLNNNPPVFPGDYVPALACVEDGSATGGFAALTPAQLQALLPTIPNVPPFAGNPYPQYQPGQVAKVCVAQQGATSVGLDGSGNVLIQYWDKVIDEEDSQIKLP